MELALAKLKEKAKGVFEHNPTAKKLIGVTEGSFFLPAAKSLAQDHARKTGCKTFEIDSDLNTTHPQEATEKLNAETAKKAREDKELQEQIAAEQKKKDDAADAAEAERIEAEKVAKAKADEITAQNVVTFGIDVAALTIKAVTEWAAKQTDVELLTAAIEVADTKGGKAAIAERIEELKNA